MVEAGQADHIVVAYFDRLVRSLKVQLEVIERVEQAGGEIFALDHGKLANGTAATRLSTNMMGRRYVLVMVWRSRGCGWRCGGASGWLRCAG